MLASNTSSIPITAIASAAADPGRVVGMHFFNPAPVMRLVEVIAGIDSSPEALDVARATGRAMGKEVIDATDGPGFLVNRCNRPFGLEALKLLQERVADVEAIDAIARAAGFRMGPFELQDLVGIDVGYEVSLSFHELSFGEPRWRPSPLSARMVAAGRLGRKSGRGWYEYPRASAEDPAPPAPGGGADRLVVVAGEVAVAHELRALAARAGFDARDQDEAEGEVPWLLIDAGADPEGPPLQGGPVALLCADGSLHALDGGGGAVGFHVLPPLEDAPLVELTRGPGTARAGRRAHRGALRGAGAAHRVGRRRAGPRARAHRGPARQRGVLRRRRGRRLARGRRRRDGARPQPSARALRVVRDDRRRARPRGARRPAHRARRGALSRGAAAAQAGHVSAGAASHESDG